MWILVPLVERESVCVTFGCSTRPTDSTNDRRNNMLCRESARTTLPTRMTQRSVVLSVVHGGLFIYCIIPGTAGMRHTLGRPSNTIETQRSQCVYSSQRVQRTTVVPKYWYCKSSHCNFERFHVPSKVKPFCDGERRELYSAQYLNAGWLVRVMTTINRTIENKIRILPDCGVLYSEYSTKLFQQDR
jgi:hypothetical protein